MSKAGVTYKNNSDGSLNKQYVDLLEEDKAISGQKFVCVSANCFSLETYSSFKK